MESPELHHDSGQEDQEIDAVDPDAEEVETVVEEVVDDVTFRSLGVSEELAKACEDMKWPRPSKIQREAIPVAISGKFCL